MHRPTRPVSPSAASSAPSPRIRDLVTRPVAVGTVLVLLAGVAGAALLSAPSAADAGPTASAEAPIAAEEPGLLDPAARVQAPDDAQAPPVAPPPIAAGFEPAPDPDEVVTMVVRVADTAWWGMERAQAAVVDAVAVAAADGGHDQGGAEITHEYRHAFEGFAVQAPRWALPVVTDAAGVDVAFIESSYRPPVDQGATALDTDVYSWANGSSLAMTGVDQVGLRGDGMVIDVIDTGLDVAHEAFAGEFDASRARLDAGDVDALRSSLGFGQRAAYVSDKIPFAWDYADGDPQVTPATGGDMTHGTHVAGIAAADGGTIRGTAPGAQLMIQKVFDDVNGAARDSVILAALDDAAQVLPDVINLSLGADAGFSVDRAGLYADVYDSLRAKGVIVSAAAGNSRDAAVANTSGADLAYASDPDRGIVSAPASYEGSVAVASIDNAKVRPFLLSAEGRHVYVAPAEPATETARVVPFTDLVAGSYGYLDAGLGTDAEAASAAAEAARSGADVARTIVLVRRGGGSPGSELTFQDKVDAVAGAFPTAPAAVLLMDDVDGLALLIPGLTHADIPVAMVSKADGDALLSSTARTLRVDGAQIDAPDTRYTASSFTSVGVTPDLQLKPDVAAPGGSIYSATLGNTYGWLSGTSMAAPQLSGILALVKESIRADGDAAGLSDLEVAQRATQRVMNTARQVDNPATPGVPYSPRVQGAGLTNVPAALSTPVRLEVPGAADPARPSASIGESAEGRFSFDVVAHNDSDDAVDYTVDVSALSDRIADGLFQNDSVDYAGRGVDVRVSGDRVSAATVSVPAGGSTTITVSLTVDASFRDAVAEAVEGTYLEGYVRLTSEVAPTLSVAYLGFVGDWSAAAVFDEPRAGGTPHLYGSALVNASSGLPLGVNPLDDEAVDRSLIDPGVIRPERAVVSPTRFSAGTTRVQPVTGMLRSADELRYDLVRDADDEVVQSYSYTQARRSAFVPQLGAVAYAEAFLPTVPVFESFAPDGAELRPGRYTIAQHATTAGPGPEEQTSSSSFTYDNEGPRVESAALSADGAALEVTVSDDTWIAAFDLQEFAGAGYFHRALGGDPTETIDGRHVFRVSLPIGSIRQSWAASQAQLGASAPMPATAVLYVWDYGLNLATPLTVTLEESAVTGVTIDQSDVRLAPEEQVRLSATLQPANARRTDIAWSSSDAAVVTVDDRGLARGVAPGRAQLVATAVGTGLSAAVDVEVADIPEEVGLVISPATVVVAEGALQSLQVLRAASLADAAVSWSSSDDTVAAVDSDGVVTGLARGAAVISVTATRPGGAAVTATAEVRVQQPDFADFVIEGDVLRGYAGTRSAIDVPVGVRAIAPYAFAGTGLTAVGVPHTVAEIGEAAFAEMPALQRVLIDDDAVAGRASVLTSIGAEAFRGSVRLTSVNLPGTLTTIGDAMLQDTSVERIDFPSSLTRIPARTLRGATHLQSVTFGDAVTEIGADALSATSSLREVRLPAALETIADNAFTSSGITSVSLPAKTRTVGVLAFAGTPLTRVDLGSVRSIGAQAFTQTAVTELVIPDSVVEVGASAFSYNRALRTVTVGRNVADGALVGVFTATGSGPSTPALERFEVPEGTANYSARDGLLYDRAGETLIAYPSASVPGGVLTVPDGTRRIADLAAFAVPATELRLPEGLERIGARAFTSTNVSVLSAPASLREIGGHAFSGSARLSDVSLPHVQKIGESAFSDDTALTRLDLGAELTEIGSAAFQGNTALKEFVVPDSVVTLGDSVLLNSVNIERVHFGARVAQIGTTVLTGLPALRELTVDPANAAYFTDRNVFYGREEDGLHLKLYLGTKTDPEYTVVDGTTVIDDQAFRGNASLERVVLPEGVVSLGSGAFNSLPRLREVVLPDSLQHVDGFYFDPSLRELDFGTNVSSFDMFWSMGTSIEHLVVRGGRDAAFTDSFGASTPPGTAFFGPGVTSVSYGNQTPRIIVVPADLAALSLPSWALAPDTVVYAPAGSAGWSAAEAGIVAAEADPGSRLRPYTTLTAGVELTTDAAGTATAVAAASGGVAETDSEERQTLAASTGGYDYRFVAVAGDGHREVLRDWSGENVWSGALPDGAALVVDVRDATRLTASATWTRPDTAPVVTTSPVAATVVEGDDATFTAAASGPGTVSVQWQSRTVDGVWSDIDGADDDTLTLRDVAASLDRSRYRAVFSNHVGSTATSEAELRVTTGTVTPPVEPGDPDRPTRTPAAPTLTPDNRGAVDAVQDGATLRAVVGPDHASQWIGVTLHPGGFVGWFRADDRGVVAATLPDEATVRRQVSFLTVDDALIGWTEIGVAPAPGPDTDPAPTTGSGVDTGAPAGGGVSSPARPSAAGASAPGTLATTGADPRHTWGTVLLAVSALGAGTIALTLRRRRVRR